MATDVGSGADGSLRKPPSKKSRRPRGAAGASLHVIAFLLQDLTRALAATVNEDQYEELASRAENLARAVAGIATPLSGRGNP